MFFNTPNNFNQNQTMPTPTNNGWNGNGSFGMNNNTVGAPNGGFNNQFSNPMAPGPLVQNQQLAMQQYHLSQIRMFYNSYEQVLRQSQIEKILYFINEQQKQSIKQIDECLKMEGGINQFQERYLKEVKQKCLALKNNNEIIFMEMFNIKQKVGRLASIAVDRNQDNEQEFQIVHEKIRRVKLQIANKLNYLKNKRLLQQTVNGTKKINRGRFDSINIALTQLQQATEVLNKQLINQRQQINVLVKQLYE